VSRDREPPPLTRLAGPGDSRIVAQPGAAFFYDLVVAALHETYDAGGRARILNTGDVGDDLPSA
jgi:hypothetical protein